MKKNLYPACPSDFLLCYTGEKLQRDDGAIINHLVLASKRGPFVVTIRNRRNYTIELKISKKHDDRRISAPVSDIKGTPRRSHHRYTDYFLASDTRWTKGVVTVPTRCFVLLVFFCIFLKQKSLLVKLSMKALTFVYFFITTFLLNEIFSCFSIFLFIDNRKIRPYAPPVQGQISPQTLM